MMIVELFFFFNDTATTEIYTLSLHDALPIWDVRDGPPAASETQKAFDPHGEPGAPGDLPDSQEDAGHEARPVVDRKSTRLNSSHANISYAVFCLKKKIKICE